MCVCVCVDSSYGMRSNPKNDERSKIQHKSVSQSKAKEEKNNKLKERQNMSSGQVFFNFSFWPSSFLLSLPLHRDKTKTPPYFTHRRFSPSLSSPSPSAFSYYFYSLYILTHCSCCTIFAHPPSPSLPPSLLRSSSSNPAPPETNQQPTHNPPLGK